MIFKLSTKSIFFILVVLITTTLVFNYINRIKHINLEKIDLSKEGKTFGVNIEQNQPNGEKKWEKKFVTFMRMILQAHLAKI